jgi:hypothetical protein
MSNFAREMDRLRCVGMSDDQLRANIRTYRTSQGANGSWFVACMVELERRGLGPTLEHFAGCACDDCVVYVRRVFV